MPVKELEVALQYGMGASCTATLEKDSVKGASARDLIRQVVRSPQRSNPSQRAARVLAEIIGSQRTVDVEVLHGDRKDDQPGKPIELDEVVVPDSNEQTPDTEKLTIQISEPYVGG